MTRISWIVNIVFALTVVAAQMDLGVAINRSVVTAACLVFIVYSGLCLWRPALGRWHGRPLLLEFLVITAVVWASGGIGSPFRSLYFLFIIESGIRFLHRGGVLASLGVCGTLAFIESVERSRLAWSVRVDDVLTSFPFFIAVGLLTGMLAQERSAEARSRAEAERQLAEGRLQAEIMRRELEIAREIQQALMPSGLPSLPGWELAWRMVPMQAVGGDLVHFHHDGGLLRCMVADVSGKGIPAALLVGSLHQMVDHLANEPPHKALREINRSLCGSTASSISVTLVLMHVDLSTGGVEWANAGHPHSLVLRASHGRVEEWESHDMATGWLEEAEFEGHRCVLHPGDVCLSYTDGLTDAVVCPGVRLGDEEVQAMLEEMRGRPLEEIADALVARGTSEAQTDDVTFFLLRRLPQESDVGTDAPVPCGTA